YVENLDEFEQNEGYSTIIEKKTETLYRSINQKTESLPTSNLAVKTNLLKTRTIDLTPQESEQLSKFVSDETYVKQQKEDIEELSAMFKQMLRETNSDEVEQVEASDAQDDTTTDEYVDTMASNFVAETDTLINTFVNAYKPELDFSASYAIILSDQERILHLQATATQVKCFYAATEEADVILRTTTKVLENIFAGKTTFQKGFMVGEISVKGNFKSIRMLDTIFDFS
ncbi:MAG: SCP2 sterol-binding domain-containing protein, partial [Lachnospiraceae bacterium]|nr:SCP2 sterol-binding domain-containing protein [Lachnospiraceae bacterium]